jgi:hypothetical protein
MRMIVLVVWVCLTAGAEIRIMADSTLVASALDVLVLAFAKRSVAEDADVSCLAVAWSSDRLV